MVMQYFLVLLMLASAAAQAQPYWWENKPTSYEFTLALEQKVEKAMIEADHAVCQDTLAGQDVLQEKINETYLALDQALNDKNEVESALSTLIKDQGPALYEEAIVESEVQYLGEHTRTDVAKLFMRKLVKKYEKFLISQEREKSWNTRIQSEFAAVKMYQGAIFYYLYRTFSLQSWNDAALGLVAIGMASSIDYAIFPEALRFLKNTYLLNEPGRTTKLKFNAAKALNQMSGPLVPVDYTQLSLLGKAFDKVKNKSLLKKIIKSANQTQSWALLAKYKNQLLEIGSDANVQSADKTIQDMIDGFSEQAAWSEKLNQSYQFWLTNRSHYLANRSIVVRGKMGSAQTEEYFDYISNKVTDVNKMSFLVQLLQDHTIYADIIGPISPKTLDEVFSKLFTSVNTCATVEEANRLVAALSDQLILEF